MSTIKGKAFCFGEDINTDLIIPARYMQTSDPHELAKHCMEDADSEFVNKVRPGDIIVGGRNFGCGSSREHAPIAIKTVGIAAVIATSFARIFYRNSFNMGLMILESKEAVEGIKEGDEVEIDPSSGKIRNITSGAEWSANPIPPFMQELVDAGGLMPYMKGRISSG